MNFRHLSKSTSTVLMAGLFAACGTARSAIILDPGSINLLPDTPNQIVSFGINNDGGAAVTGVGVLNFAVEVLNGNGTQIANPGADIYPRIPAVLNQPSGVDLSSAGKLFAGGLQSGTNNFSGWEGSIITVSGSISIPAGNSVLGTVKFDTTGITGPATFQLRFFSSHNDITQTTEFYLDDLDATVVPISAVTATLAIVPVPEPEVTAAAAALGLLGVSRLIRRKKQA